MSSLRGSSKSRPSGDQHWTRIMKKENQAMSDFLNEMGLVQVFKDYKTSEKDTKGSAYISLPASSSKTSDDDGYKHVYEDVEDHDHKDDGDSGDESSDPDDDYDPFNDNGEGTGYIKIALRMTIPFMKYPMGSTMFVRANPRWKARTLKYLLSEKMNVRASHFALYKSNGNYIFDHLTICQNTISENSILNVMVLGKGGASSKKRKQFENNPFADEDVIYPSSSDAPAFQEAFNSSVQMTSILKDTIDVKAIFSQTDASTLDFIVQQLTTGKAHHNVKIAKIVDEIPFIKNSITVKKMIENSCFKYKNMLCAKLWELGSVDGNFKMDTLVAFIQGVRSQK